MANTNGPPIRQRITDLQNGWRLRSSYGDTPNGIQRFDIHDGKGWRDFAWRDKETDQVMHLWDGKPSDGKVTMAALGKSQWAGRGPAVPAERGCFDCHRGIATARADDPELASLNEIEATLLMNLIALNPGTADWGKRPTVQPAPVVPGPRGPEGPRGPAGPQGEPYKLTQADKNEITSAVREGIIQWIRANADEFKGADGAAGKAATEAELLALIRRVVDEKAEALTGKPGADGKPGVVTVRVIRPDDTTLKEFNAVRSGSTVVVRAKEFEVKK